MKNANLTKNKIVIPNDNILLTASEEVKHISQPLFKKTPITYFDLTRINSDGSFSEISSHGMRGKLMYENECYILPTIPSKLLNNLKFYFFIPEKQCNDLFLKCRDLLNIDNFFLLFEKNIRYTDIYCFGTSIDYSNAINFYINNIETLVNYGHFFKEKADYLIKEFNQNKIILPMIHQKRSFDILKKSKSITFKQNRKIFNITQLTPREKECFNYLSKGYSVKETARLCSLSFRTVETHWEHIKNKLNISNLAMLRKRMLEIS